VEPKQAEATAAKAVDMSDIILDLDRKQSNPVTRKLCPRGSKVVGDHGALGVRSDGRLVCGVKTCDHIEASDDRPWPTLPAAPSSLTVQ
jgi:hypothetical protein